MNDTYRGWTIRHDPPPIQVRSFDWTAYGPGYDASYEGEEDGFVDNGEKASGATREEVIGEIDAWFENNPGAIEHDVGDGLGELITTEEGRRRIDQYITSTCLTCLGEGVETTGDGSKRRCDCGPKVSPRNGAA
jgi:hypothetical protein